MTIGVGAIFRSVTITKRVVRSTYSFGLTAAFGARCGSAGLGGCRNVRKRSKRWPSEGFFAAGAPARLSAVLSVDMSVTFSGRPEDLIDGPDGGK